VCEHNVCIGTGGDENFKFHQKSKDHQKKLMMSTDRDAQQLVEVFSDVPATAL
jgi:hypothetical protein